MLKKDEKVNELKRPYIKHFHEILALYQSVTAWRPSMPWRRQPTRAQLASYEKLQHIDTPREPAVVAIEEQETVKTPALAKPTRPITAVLAESNLAYERRRLGYVQMIPTQHLNDGEGYTPAEFAKLQRCAEQSEAIHSKFTTDPLLETQAVNDAWLNSAQQRRRGTAQLRHDPTTDKFMPLNIYEPVPTSTIPADILISTAILKFRDAEDNPDHRLPHRIKVSMIRFYQHWAATGDDKYFVFDEQKIPIVAAQSWEFKLDQIHLF